MRERATQRGTRAWAAVEFQSALMGLPNEAESSEALRHGDLADMGFADLARSFLQEAGISPPADKRELFARALTSSDFANVTADLVNKTLQQSYQYAPGTFAIWTAKGAASNFLTTYIDRISPPSDLPEVLEDGEYTLLKVKAGAEPAKIRQFGGILGITRQALINNEHLRVFKDTGRVLGQTAKMTQNRLAYKRLLANPALSDGLAVFHADRGNLLTGADSALSRNSLALAVKTLRMLTDDAGNPLAVEPKFLLVPPSLEITAHELCFSDSIPGQNNSAVPNLFKKIGIIPVVEPLLESPVIPGYSAASWYLLPDPTLWPVFLILALGKEDNLEPYVESRAVFNRDEVQYKVRTDFDCCAIGCKAVKSAGQ